MSVNNEISLSPMSDDVIFAMDIGTRTIIGVVGVQRDERFLVQAAEMVVHESRAMLTVRFMILLRLHKEPPK